eukprot:c5054_g1_i1.p2 GENE.c5054_g1_i1~~c5054_g1_i1.p2  ORF type:complete len:117 (-),score=22.92 c5054_g1_i1:128-478(-)
MALEKAICFVVCLCCPRCFLFFLHVFCGRILQSVSLSVLVNLQKKMIVLFFSSSLFVCHFQKNLKKKTPHLPLESMIVLFVCWNHNVLLTMQAIATKIEKSEVKIGFEFVVGLDRV